KNRRQPALGGEHTRISTSLPASLVCLSGCSPPSVFKSRRGLTPTHCYSSIARVGGQGVGPKFHPSIPPPGEQAEGYPTSPTPSRSLRWNFANWPRICGPLTSTPYGCRGHPLAVKFNPSSGHGVMVTHQPSKLLLRVRIPLPALPLSGP